jgi:hypothetical protein
MIVKASACSTMILSAALLVFIAGPSPAATGGNDSNADTELQNAAAAPVALHKHGLRYHWIYARRKSHKVARKPAADRDSAAAAEIVADAGKALPEIPPSIANANAQLITLAAPDDSARMMSARANDLLQAPLEDGRDARADDEIFVVAEDQLNDVDRSLREASPPPAPSANPPPAHPASASHESSIWSETSLIGKIFIALGALLTMASAARLFMA